MLSKIAMTTKYFLKVILWKIYEEWFCEKTMRRQLIWNIVISENNYKLVLKSEIVKTLGKCIYNLQEIFLPYFKEN